MQTMSESNTNRMRELMKACVSCQATCAEDRERAARLERATLSEEPLMARAFSSQSTPLPSSPAPIAAPEPKLSRA